jgi:hypothetical protein
MEKAHRSLVFLIEVAGTQTFCDRVWTSDVTVEIVSESPADYSLCLGDSGVKRGTRIAELER